MVTGRNIWYAVWTNADVTAPRKYFRGAVCINRSGGRRAHTITKYAKQKRGAIGRRARRSPLFCVKREVMKILKYPYGKGRSRTRPTSCCILPLGRVIGPDIPRVESEPQCESCRLARHCALPGFVDSKNEEKTERNAGYLVVSHSGGGMLRQGTRKGIRRTPANRGMRAHWVVKGLDISEDVCHGMCP